LQFWDRLRRKRPGFTAIGDAELIHLKGLKKLRTLHLNCTNVTDAGLEHLKALDNLQSLDLTSTRVTEAAVNELRRLRPALVIEHSVGEGFRSDWFRLRDSGKSGRAP
jgi:hypothetical protein